MITKDQVRFVIEKGGIIEDYPDDPRGHIALVLAFCQGRPLHVVCSPKQDYLAIITAYVPNSRKWDDHGRRRK